MYKTHPLTLAKGIKLALPSPVADGNLQIFIFLNPVAPTHECGSAQPSLLMCTTPTQAVLLLIQCLTHSILLSYTWVKGSLYCQLKYHWHAMEEVKQTTLLFAAYLVAILRWKLQKHFRLQTSWLMESWLFSQAQYPVAQLVLTFSVCWMKI